MDTSAVPSNDSSPADSHNNALVRFAGDTGESMQLAGKRFSRRLAREGATLVIAAADSPATPAFQIRFGGAGSGDADPVDVLVVFDEAALADHLVTLRRGGQLILNTRVSAAADLAHADVNHVPRIGTVLDDYCVIEVDFDALTRDAVGHADLRGHELLRCRNYAALGVVCRLLEEPTENIRCRTADTAPALVRANRRALLAGCRLGEHLAAAGGRGPRMPSMTRQFAA